MKDCEIYGSQTHWNAWNAWTKSKKEFKLEKRKIRTIVSFSILKVVQILRVKMYIVHRHRLRFIKLNATCSFNVSLIYLHRFIQMFEKSVTAWNHESILNGMTTAQRQHIHAHHESSSLADRTVQSNLFCAIHWIREPM